MKFGFPARLFAPSLAMMTPLPVAMVLPSPGAPGVPLDAWISMFASPSCRGLPGSGLNGQLAPFAGRAAGWAAAGGWASEPEGRIWTCESGMICATAELASREATAAADSVAATSLGSDTCTRFVPPSALMAATTGAWSAAVAPRTAAAWVRMFMSVCWTLSTTMTAPPFAAPSTAGALGPLVGVAIADDAKVMATIVAIADDPATPTSSRRARRRRWPFARCKSMNAAPFQGTRRGVVNTERITGASRCAWSPPSIADLGFGPTSRHHNRAQPAYQLRQFPAVFPRLKQRRWRP